MEATMTNGENCNGFTTLDEFIDSLLPDDITYNNNHLAAQMAKDKAESHAHVERIEDSEIIRNSELPREVTEVEKNKDQKSEQKQNRPTHLESPMQTLMQSLDNAGPIQCKTNFNNNSPSSVMYSPPLSPECVVLNSPLNGEEAMMFPGQMHQQGDHIMLNGVPTFIGDKSFEKSYIYDPKPLTRKTRRALVPDEQKNQKYWMKRMRNNVAARKSREDRRRKELEVLTTMNALQEENQKMKNFINEVVKANEQLVSEMMRMRHQMNYSNGPRSQSLS